MKTYSYFFVGLIATIFLLSCEGEGFYIDKLVDFRILQEKACEYRGQFSVLVNHQVPEQYDDTITVSSWHNAIFKLSFSEKIDPQVHREYVEDKECKEAWNHFWVAKTRGMVDYFNERGSIWHGLTYWYMGALDGARVTADKILFERPAGTDIGDCFSYIPVEYESEDHVILSFPDFIPLRDLEFPKDTITFSECFAAGNAITNPAAICAYDEPKERYEYVTLTFTVPFEWSSFEDFVDVDWVEDNVTRRTESLSRSVTLHFTGE